MEGGGAKKEEQKQHNIDELASVCAGGEEKSRGGSAEGLRKLISVCLSTAPIFGCLRYKRGGQAGFPGRS